jgi:predicted O-methyltransferase YrrM
MNENTINNLIAEIKNEIPDFNISKDHLEKFTESKTDQEFLSYLNGVGGNYIKFLSLLVNKIKFKNIVELGSREGLSTLAIYDQLPRNSKFATIDIVKDQRYCPESMFNDERVSFIFGDVCSLNTIKQLPFDIDFLFSDTIHFYSQIKDEFEIYQHLLADKALVAIDDIRLNDQGIFWDELPFPKWDLTSLCHQSGWGLFLFERKDALTTEERWGKVVESSSIVWENKYHSLLSTVAVYRVRSIKNKLKSLVKKAPPIYKSVVYFSKLLQSWK